MGPLNDTNEAGVSNVSNDTNDANDDYVPGSIVCRCV